MERHRKDAEREICDRAAMDAEFRDALIRDPRAVLQQEFEITEWPDGLSVRVIEETAEELILVLPP